MSNVINYGMNCNLAKTLCIWNIEAIKKVEPLINVISEKTNDGFERLNSKDLYNKYWIGHYVEGGDNEKRHDRNLLGTKLFN